jgi:hypothetical protein
MKSHKPPGSGAHDDDDSDADDAKSPHVHDDEL